MQRQNQAAGATWYKKWQKDWHSNIYLDIHLFTTIRHNLGISYITLNKKKKTCDSESLKLIILTMGTEHI